MRVVHSMSHTYSNVLVVVIGCGRKNVMCQPDENNNTDKIVSTFSIERQSAGPFPYSFYTNMIKSTIFFQRDWETHKNYSIDRDTPYIHERLYELRNIFDSWIHSPTSYDVYVYCECGNEIITINIRACAVGRSKYYIGCPYGIKNENNSRNELFFVEPSIR